MYHARMALKDSGGSALGSSRGTGAARSAASVGGFSASGGKGYIPARNIPVRVNQKPQSAESASRDAAYRDGYRAGDKNVFSSEKPVGRLANDAEYRRMYAQGHRAAVSERYDADRSRLKRTMSEWSSSRNRST